MRTRRCRHWFAALGLGLSICLWVTADAQTLVEDPLRAPAGSLSVDFKQSANEDAPLPLGSVHWINGILNDNNSEFYEGMSTLQRIVVLGVPATLGDTHTLALSHEATKGGVHAYDFLTSWTQAVDAADTIVPGQGLLTTLNPCGDAISADAAVACDAIHAGAFFLDVDVPDAMPDPAAGGDVSARILAYEQEFGNRTIRLRGDAPIASAALTFDGYTGTDASQDANYTLSWVSASTNVVIEVGGHLSVGVDPLKAGIGYGAGLGASSISGGPYHFSMGNIDGSTIGSMDNQIAGAAVRAPPSEPPPCGADNNGPLCVGDALVLTTPAAVDAMYLWTGPDGFLADTATAGLAAVTPVNAGTYTVVVTLAGVSSTCSTEVVVYSLPDCAIEGGDEEPVCPGSVQVFVAPAGMVAYQWGIAGDGEIAGSTDGGSVTVMVAQACSTSFTLTLNLTNANGCASECSREVAVDDAAPPTASDPAPISVQCAEDVPDPDPAVVTDEADNCGVPVVAFAADASDGESCPETIARTYSVTDGCGNSITVTQTITVADTIAPTIVCPPSVTVQTLDAIPDAAATVGELIDQQGAADDNCVGPLTLSHVDTTVTNGVCGGLVTRRYVVTDVCGNTNFCEQAIRISDTTPPQITCPPGFTVYSTNDVPPGTTNLVEFGDMGGAVTDNNGDGLILTYEDGPYVGDGCDGTIARRYTVADACGNSDSCDQTIRVLNRPPEVTCPPDRLYSCDDCPEDTSTNVMGSATAVDPEGGQVSISYSDEVVGLCPKVTVRTWTATDDCGNEDSCVQTIACLPPVLVTSSSLCTFDVDLARAGRQFRLLYTYDGKHKLCQKLTASNPGQFFLNILYEGVPGDTVSFQLTLPHPYVTQGATPLHAYDGVGVSVGSDGSVCLLPGNTIWQSQDQVTLDMYGTGDEVTIDADGIVVPDSGIVYLNMHMDFGLKGLGGLARTEDLDAIQCRDTDGNGILDVIIPNFNPYTFAASTTNAPPMSAEDWVENSNDFKHVPGVAGLVLTSGAAAPVSGVTVSLLNAKGKVVTSTVTDLYGTYVFSYKHLGKNTQYYVAVDLPGGGRQMVPVTLGDDGYQQINFEIDR